MPICQHRGCGQDYDPANNPDGCCKYHPGAPIFHEGLKGWSCCPKRFTDFTDFLNYPGCASGAHTDEAPQDDSKDPNEALKELAQVKVDRLSLEQRTAASSMRDGAPKVELPLKTTASLERALAQQAETAAKEIESQEVQPGQACTHNACKGSYVDESSNEEDCFHHPGTPVFHEGYKYWSCCPKKKTYEFDEFLDFKGCTVGKHRWFKPAEESAKAKQCRYDWFQSDTHVVLTVFAKCIEPSRTSVKANADSITIDIVYSKSFTFQLELHLGGNIIPAESTVQLLSTKMDIKLAKAPGEAWAALTADGASSQ
ncbi:uncharacterized protein MONBRDRAFT_31101 [Monosiga brevicollis MX1]|uniref:CHORD domain-containing protein n=1 Tax=Monosiga brevicollis TaxID=81824 RepID=A9URR2_MONBE|nr:uncharacterized protein MONBRDRAFT_31101 [Monosiga brevicollis MX1]EDQ91650.1 predicted protein [Monosiga brevicollis MX1]|eukprot:XP_001742936.1 hypothetical protein [Monosiga brevicollis MX1]